ncbi:MAG: hypothetical protein PHG66_01660 [Candidatus Colwellbacteria bacterium]|nr:hypothetical protein [Candidatus Colwellbacteria bacterium]
MLLGISVDNLLSLLRNGGIICFLGGRGNATKNLTSYLTDQFEGSKKLVSTTICESNLVSDIVDTATSFFAGAHESPLREDENGNFTFVPEKPSLIFLKQVNTRIWDEPAIEILTDRRDDVKCIKVFAASYIETIPLDIRKRTDIWIITRDCSKGSVYTLFSSILKNYEFDEFMSLLDEHRALIVWRTGERSEKGFEYKLYSFSDVCPEKSMDIKELVESVTYQNISDMILEYSYRVM